VESSVLGPVDCRPRMIAALVRFSDEICEHSNRASHLHINSDTLPPGNKLFHLYAYSLKGAIPVREEKAFKLQFDFDAKYLDQRYPTPKHTNEVEDLKFLLDETIERIIKLDTERRYCNRFLAPPLQTDRLIVRLMISHTEIAAQPRRLNTWEEWNFNIVESGYPDSSNNWHRSSPELDGQNIATKLREARA